MAPVFLIAGIDELMDMAHTPVNVIGICLYTCVVAKREGEFGSKTPALPEVVPA